MGLDETRLISWGFFIWETKMLNRPNERILKSLHALKSTEEWVTVREWIADSLNQMRKDSGRITDEVLLRWHQGACQALDTLLEYETKTKTILEKGETH